MADSYDLLARSIERVIRGDLPPPASEQQLASSIDRIMAEESRAGELRLAYLRLAVVAAFAVTAFGAFVSRRGDSGMDSADALTAGVAAAWLGVATVLALALRRGWYRRWVPHVMPAADAAMIAAAFLLPLLGDDAAARRLPAEALAMLTALCAFLGTSRGLRLSRSSTHTGTALALVVFAAVGVVARLDPLPAVAIAAMLVGTGLVAASITQLVRRVVTDEVAKATLSQM